MIKTSWCFCSDQIQPNREVDVVPGILPEVFRHVCVGTDLHFHRLRNRFIFIRKQDSQKWPENDPGYDNHERGDKYREVQQLLTLDDDPSSELDVDKPTEDDGGVEDEGEGPKCDPQRHVVDTVNLRIQKAPVMFIGLDKK